MNNADGIVLHRHTGAGLLRAAVMSATDLADQMPDPADILACRGWLAQVWSEPDVAEAIGHASPTLGRRVEALRSGRCLKANQIRRAALATARYLLRGTGRPTPFGLFAGVAPVALGDGATARWGTGHRTVVRADTEWLAAVIERLEAIPDLLHRLDVTVTNLAVRRGGRWEAPHGPGRVRLTRTTALDEVCRAAAAPIQFDALAGKLAGVFGVEAHMVGSMLGELVRQGVLITCLRAPFTVTDPLGHLVDQLHDAGAATPPAAAVILEELEGVRDLICHHNRDGSRDVRHPGVPDAVSDPMRRLAASRRGPVAVDVALDCQVRLPDQVATELEYAAGVLLRLAREPGGSPVWAAYHRAFVDRYGIGSLVAVTEVVNPDTGLGYPATYPGSVLPEPADAPVERDQRLLALAFEAVTDGSREILLTDQMVHSLAGDSPADTRPVPPHIEVAARIQAASPQALDAGDYTLRISPARAGGVMTSRFTLTATGSGLEQVYRNLPTGTEGALRVQMSFGAAYPHAENITRVPAYLPHVLCLGEHRGAGGEEASIIGLDDVAVTATPDRLHLVSLSRRRVIEPQVFHALNLDKHAPPLVRFLANLDRGFTHGWTSFDWGPHAATMPFLPRIRYRRAILSPARWRLTADQLPRREANAAWRQALADWRRRWRCPATVELRENDRGLRLDLDQPLPAAILYAHLDRHGHAPLTEAAGPGDYGWIDGHAHEVVLPLASAQRPLPAPRVVARSRPKRAQGEVSRVAAPAMVTNADGQMPGAPGARWLYARLHTHPERIDDILIDDLPTLITDLGGAQVWFVRYRSPEQTDHLRLRIHLPTPDRYGPSAARVGAWAQRLHDDGLANRLVLDTYRPETGRYGTGPTLAAAEAVFVADSTLVAAQLRHRPALRLDPTALTAVNLVGITCGLLNGENPDDQNPMAWLIARPVSASPPSLTVDRAAAKRAITLATRLAEPQDGAAVGAAAGWPDEVSAAWQARACALGTYRRALSGSTEPGSADQDNAGLDLALESLLHMHHNRALGIDRDSESTCRRLARHAALSWRSQHSEIPR